jgi:hypothetical protein
VRSASKQLLPNLARLTLGEWCREVLLAQANANEGKRSNIPEQTLLAEVMALRTILLNVFFKLSQGEPLTAEEMEHGHFESSASLQEFLDGCERSAFDLRAALVPMPGTLRHSEGPW